MRKIKIHFLVLYEKNVKFSQILAFRTISYYSKIGTYNELHISAILFTLET